MCHSVLCTLSLYMYIYIYVSLLLDDSLSQTGRHIKASIGAQCPGSANVKANGQQGQSQCLGRMHTSLLLTSDVCLCEVNIPLSLEYWHSFVLIVGLCLYKYLGLH